MGSGSVSPSSVDYLLLLHLERSQVHWESECRDVDITCTRFVACVLFDFYILPQQVSDKKNVAQRKPTCVEARLI